MYIFSSRMYNLQDDELDEETEKLLNEDAILKSPSNSNASNSPEEPLSSSLLAADVEAKKITLKRQLVTSLDDAPVSLTTTIPSKAARIEAPIITPAPSTPIATEASTASTADSGDESRKIKLTELTLEKRLELRAKKFGAPASADAVKVARAERFGIKAADDKPSASNGASANTIRANAPVASVDLLKKRAERFGGSVSNVMNKIELSEKLQKRQERFGVTAAETAKTETAKTETATTETATTESTKPAANSEYAEKARLRLERFKTAVN